MGERRAAPRRAANLPIQYRLVGESQVEDIRDISRSGVFVTCREPLPLGSRIEMSIPEVPQGLLRVECTVVRVVWGGRIRGILRDPGMALRFEDLDEKKQIRIDRLLNHLRELSALRRAPPPPEPDEPV
jgi:hypothetical protein